MPGQAKQRTPNSSVPNWGGPVEWAFWSLSLVLREISESQAANAKKRDLRQGLEKDALSGCDRSESDE